MHENYIFTFIYLASKVIVLNAYIFYETQRERRENNLEKNWLRKSLKPGENNILT